jgi:hypothetical protein
MCVCVILNSLYILLLFIKYLGTIEYAIKMQFPECDDTTPGTFFMRLAQGPFSPPQNLLTETHLIKAQSP